MMMIYLLKHFTIVYLHSNFNSPATIVTWKNTLGIFLLFFNIEQFFFSTMINQAKNIEYGINIDDWFIFFIYLCIKLWYKIYIIRNNIHFTDIKQQ